MYGIWCEVFGGVTGHRTSWLKSKGEVLRYDTPGEAQVEASRLSRYRNNPPSSTGAVFSYTVKKMEE